MVVVSLSIPDDLLRELDDMLVGETNASRSEVVRQALREYIMEYRKLNSISGDVVATVTALYAKVDKSQELMQLQHEFEDILTTYLHSHVTEDKCLEIMLIRGPSERLKSLVDGLMANKQVENVKISVIAAE